MTKKAGDMDDVRTSSRSGSQVEIVSDSDEYYGATHKIYFMIIDWNQIVTAGIGVISALSGVALSEYFKKQEREALFSDTIFKKKLEVYEELYKRLNTISNQAHDLAKNNLLSEKERLRSWSGVVLPFAEFLDSNDLYIAENIKLHAIVSIVGVEEIAGLSEKQQKKRTGSFNQDFQRAKNMIREEIGIKRLEKFFNKVNKPDLESRFTEYARELKSKKDDK